MDDKRDPAYAGRDEEAEKVASRKGVPIEEAKKTVAKPDPGDRDAGAAPGHPDRRR